MEGRRRRGWELSNGGGLRRLERNRVGGGRGEAPMEGGDALDLAREEGSGEWICWRENGEEKEGAGSMKEEKTKKERKKRGGKEGKRNWSGDVTCTSALLFVVF